MNDDERSPASEDEGDGGTAPGDAEAPATAADGPTPARIEYDDATLGRLMEALLFVSHRPVPLGQLARAARTTFAACRRALGLLRERLADRGICLAEIGGAYQLRTAPEFATLVGRFLDAKPIRLSKASVEVLAAVAYRQPITKPEIDDIRGVDSGSAVRLLLDRGLIRILGRKEEPGRPLLYGTTAAFLEFFGLPSLRDLPALKDFADLTEESRRQLERDLFAPPPDEQGADRAGERTAGLRVPARHWKDMVEVLGADLGDLPEGVEVMPEDEDRPPGGDVTSAAATAATAACGEDENDNEDENEYGGREDEE